MKKLICLLVWLQTLQGSAGCAQSISQLSTDSYFIPKQELRDLFSVPVGGQSKLTLKTKKIFRKNHRTTGTIAAKDKLTAIYRSDDFDCPVNISRVIEGSDTSYSGFSKCVNDSLVLRSLRIVNGVRENGDKQEGLYLWRIPKEGLLPDESNFKPVNK